MMAKLHGILSPQCKLRIPTPTVAKRAQYTDQPAHDNAGNVSSASALTSSASSELDEYVHTQRQEMRAMVGELRNRLCGIDGDMDESQRLYAFSPSEITALIRSAGSIKERLMVILFMTTGVRIGGMARIQLTVDTINTVEDVPPTAVTLEKGNKSRVIPLTRAVRALIVQWWRFHRPTNCTSSYLFPSPEDTSTHVSTSHIWKLCRQLFDKANVHGNHVHPHTFRHSVIKMLYNTGRTFDQIAKFIGHASSQITAGVYGRLTHEELLSVVAVLDFDKTQWEAAKKKEWHNLISLLKEPYEDLGVHGHEKKKRNEAHNDREGLKRRIVEESKARHATIDLKQQVSDLESQLAELKRRLDS